MAIHQFFCIYFTAAPGGNLAPEQQISGLSKSIYPTVLVGGLIDEDNGTRCECSPVYQRLHDKPTVSDADLAASNTSSLCHALANSPDEQYRARVAALLVRRGATVERCTRLIHTDNAVATGIAVAGVAAAAGAAAKNSGGGYYMPQAYGVAWDQFYGQNYSLIWRCRDKATGRFVDDYYCSSMPMNDATWPGWSA